MCAVNKGREKVEGAVSTQRRYKDCVYLLCKYGAVFARFKEYVGPVDVPPFLSKARQLFTRILMVQHWSGVDIQWEGIAIKQRGFHRYTSAHRLLGDSKNLFDRLRHWDG